MLPFQKPKTVAGLIIQKRKPDGQKDPSPQNEQDESSNDGMHAVAEDILRAIASKDAQHLALALKSAWDIMDSSEGPSQSDDSFESMNMKAAKDQE